MKSIFCKTDSNRGDAMLISIVMLMIFAVLGAILLSSAGSLLISAKSGLAAEQAKIYAVSMSDKIERELTGVKNITDILNSESELSNYFYENMSIFYDKDKNNGAFWKCIEVSGAEEGVRHFVTEYDEENNLPKTELKLYWSCDGTEDFDHTKIYVGVKCVFGSMEYEETREYFVTGDGTGWYCQNEPVGKVEE